MVFPAFELVPYLDGGNEPRQHFHHEVAKNKCETKEWGN